MRENYETGRPGTTAGTPQFANAGAIQKFPVYSMYKREPYITHVHGRMKVQSFLPEFSGRRIAGAAVLVHVRTLESAGACSKLTQACPVHLEVPEEVILHKNRDRK